MPLREPQLREHEVLFHSDARLVRDTVRRRAQSRATGVPRERPRPPERARDPGGEDPSITHLLNESGTLGNVPQNWGIFSREGFKRKETG